MNKDKVLLENLVTSKKISNEKKMDMKRGVMDSNNYFRETFKPLLELFSTLSEKNTSHISNTTNKKETVYTSDKDSNSVLNSSFYNFLISNPKSQHLTNLTVCITMWLTINLK